MTKRIGPKLWKRYAHELATQILFILQVGSVVTGCYCLGGGLLRGAQISALVFGSASILAMLLPRLRPTPDEVARQIQRTVNAGNYGAVVLIVTEEEKVITGISLPKWVDLEVDKSLKAINFTLDTGEVDRAWTTLRFVTCCGQKLHELEAEFMGIGEGIVSMFESHGIEPRKKEPE